MLHRLLLPALRLAVAAYNHQSADRPRIDFGPGTGFSHRDGRLYQRYIAGELSLAECSVHLRQHYGQA